ncbi:MAG TPA: hypothetical protein VN327_16980 [Pseudonocardiaceae bacterium]|nr:hypothetical protein [Pseudonocardiaceae bacterium]
MTIDRARVLRGQLGELLEAVLGMVPSLGTDVFTPPEHREP